MHCIDLANSNCRRYLFILRRVPLAERFSLSLATTPAELPGLRLTGKAEAHTGRPGMRGTGVHAKMAVGCYHAPILHQPSLVNREVI